MVKIVGYHPKLAMEKKHTFLNFEICDLSYGHFVKMLLLLFTVKAF